jgi:hypothetical protein
VGGDVRRARRAQRRRDLGRQPLTRVSASAAAPHYSARMATTTKTKAKSTKTPKRAAKKAPAKKATPKKRARTAKAS